MDLSIVIPAYNEGERIRASLDRLLAHSQAMGLSHEILVVDDGSLDATAQAVTALNHPAVRLLSLGRNRGKGAAVARGMLEARGDFRVYLDADLSTPVHELEALLGHLRSGADVAVGSRALDPSRVRRHQPAWREAAGKLFGLAVRLLGLSTLRDTQCGFKGFSARAVERLFPLLTVEGFCFDVELLLLARREGLSIVEFPVEWSDSERSSLRLLRHGPGILRDLLRLAWLHRKNF